MNFVDDFWDAVYSLRFPILVVGWASFALGATWIGILPLLNEQDRIVALLDGIFFTVLGVLKFLIYNHAKKRKEN